MPNHLISESSPYLLQHVNNPVDWYPWSDAALTLSRENDRPIFLSVGYSACHWCHVMEHESFENPDIASLMNQWFVCIKVDREERPDLDQIYMCAVQAMTGSGGWPMSVFLTPELKPFFGGTYWPPTARWGRPGFREILAGVYHAWQNRRQAVDDQADELTKHVQQMASSSIPPSRLGVTTLENAMRALIRAADPVHGGFGSAPKFPHPMDLRLGLRLWKRFREVPTMKSSSEELLKLVTLPLDKMACGGIYDHLGGGFARYSTDERWLVPHFEKMLYDNAQLVPAYLEAFQITGRNDFAKVVRETLDYTLREMTQPQGGFYSTQDADSEGIEGKFFVWSESEVDAVLKGYLQDPERRPSPPAGSVAVTNEQIVSAFKQYYNVTSHGNWEHSNILNRPEKIDRLAKSLELNPDELESIFASCRNALFEVRSKRIWPGCDEKVLVSWNGLMIGAMAMGASILKDARYADAACSAADFILREMVAIDSRQDLPLDFDVQSIDPAAKTSFRLRHGFKDGRARFNGYLDDYAALIDGLCELYQCVFDVKYLEAAIQLAEQMLDAFWDRDSGGFFYTSKDHEKLIARIKETQDNATPSGNSLAAIGLLKLARLTGRNDFAERAVATLEVMSGHLERLPFSAGLSLMSLDFLVGPTYEVTIVQPEPPVDSAKQSSRDDPSLANCPSLDQIHQRFIPNKVLHYRSADATENRLKAPVRDVLVGKVSQKGQLTGYFCQNGICGAPIVGQKEIESVIERL